MADYNVNMKQWNGTSFDNVLPLAYNAKQLEGQSLAEVKQWVQDNGLLLYTGNYTGTGTYGDTNPVSIQFPFEPKLFIFPISTSGDYSASSPLITSFLTTSYKQVGRVSYVNNNISVYGEELMARFSDSSRKKLQIYSTRSASSQSNASGKTYYFAAIGGYDRGGVTEWTVTQSGTWTVPRTGRYYIELYGGGGSTTFRSYYQGGSSCQSYDSISLTAGNVFNVTIGNGLNASQGGTRGETTTFGQYSVLGGEKGSDNAGGAGSGNKGTNGQYANTLGVINSSTGILGENYGYGVNGMSGSYTIGGPGAVYIKYLGA